ncbi:MAG: hypothetical protein KGH62_02420, partial [Candidatus Micrarchaeota archaeon]|nr:hypothetical protein [Candidatus Micrarchaeota archaeon]
MQNVYVMSHASDIDGVGSAALIKKKFALPDSHLFFTVYSSESIEYVNKMLKGRYASGLTLFIADLGVNDSIADSYLRILKQVKAHGGKVFWFDHHPWTNKAIKMLTPLCDAAIIGENSEYCATEITQKELGLNDSFSKIFTKIVHYSDFNITPKSKSDHKTVGAYALSITYYNTNKSWGKITAKLRHIADVISKGKLLDATITADANKFQKINEDRTREMITDLTVRKDFALGFSKHI